MFPYGDALLTVTMVLAGSPAASSSAQALGSVADITGDAATTADAGLRVAGAASQAVDAALQDPEALPEAAQ